MLFKRTMNTIDLHMHSTHSDGSFSPGELVRLAEKKNLKVIAITDHDTVTHVKEALLAGEVSTVEVISGVEVSADFSRGTMHILGYFIDPENDALYQMLGAFRKGRDERNPVIVEKLKALGIEIEYQEVLKEAGGVSVGRPHIAKVLLRKGVINTLQEAFNKYLAKGAPAYVDRTRFSSEEIINVIHEAGGLAFLAHPKQLKREDKRELIAVIDQLIAEGIDGIEVYSSCHTKKETKLYRKIAEEKNLLISGGSDFHGVVKKNINLGFIGPGINLDPGIVEEMKKRLAVL